jgi:hypothetical protein
LNGRIHEEEATPEERIAAVVKSLCTQMRKTLHGREPDYADFRDVLRPYIQKELLMARIHEARLFSGLILTDRVRTLGRELDALRFPSEQNLKGPNVAP